MLGDIHIKLPESVPKSFWFALLALISALALLFIPEVRQALQDLFRGAQNPPSPAVNTPAPGPELTFPPGCAALAIKFNVEGNPKLADLRIDRLWRLDLLQCNPTPLRRAGKSTLIDVHGSESVARVALIEGVAVLGIREDTKHGYVEAIRCRPSPAIHIGSWEALIPDTLHMLDMTSALSPAERSARFDECKSGRK